MALQGTLDTFALPDVLRLLAATKKTGRLRISGARGDGSAWVDGGAVAGVEAAHAPFATDPIDALFELLRFEEGSFTFEPDAVPDADGERHDVEAMVDGAEALLREWREIESVVPSMGAWVRLRRHLDDSVTIDPGAWTTLVAVGTGVSVADLAHQLELAELPVARAVRDLVELGVAELAPEAPAPPAPVAGPVDAEPVSVLPATPLDLADADADADVEARADLDVHADDADPSEPEEEPHARRFARAADLGDRADPADPAEDAAVSEPSEPGGLGSEASDAAALPIAAPIRARRERGLSRSDDRHREPERFVPLELPGGVSGSYDGPVAGGEVATDLSEPGVDDLAAAFPGLANRTAGTETELPDDDLTRQLATLSPRAAEAVRTAAAAATDEERQAAIEAAAADAEEPVSRGLLLKFLSSVKS